MKNLIFTDIDGTLINDQHVVTPKTKEAIQKRIDSGDLFIPVSARMPAAIKVVADTVTNRYPMIAYNGAMLLDENDEIIESHPFPVDDILQIISLIKENYPNVAWNVYADHKWFSPKMPGNIQEENIVKVKSIKADISDIEKLPSCHKALLIGSAEEIDALQNQLREKFPDLSIVKSNATLLEIMTKGINKGNALEAMMKHYGISLDNTWAFGDNFNDEQMLQRAGHSVAMGNAPDEVKKSAQIVTDTNNKDGIAAVLNKYFD